MKKALLAAIAVCAIASPFFLSVRFCAADEKAFIASTDSKKYHRASCELVKRIYKPDRVYFESSAKAAKAGYIPCFVCHPDKEEPEEIVRSSSDPWGRPERPARIGSSMTMPGSEPSDKK